MAVQVMSQKHALCPEGDPVVVQVALDTVQVRLGHNKAISVIQRDVQSLFMVHTSASLL